ncbi:MAG: hypothetical protein ABIA59_06055 [Candidatus Latescibacterota bacterium]
MSKALLVIIAIVALPPSAHTYPSKPVETYDWTVWGAAADTLRSVRAYERLSLGWPFILAQSESVFVDQRMLHKQEYDINYQRGLLRLKVPLSEQAVVRISYTRLPILLAPVYSLREAVFSEPLPSSSAMPAVPAERRREERQPTNLHFGGTKSVSFAFGSNKGSALDQSLKATIEGNLTPSIKVKALLSDNNLPIQPEGNTEELEQLDKVFVEISSDRGKATLGDFSFHNSISKYSSFSRELRGVSTELYAGASSFSLAGASSKGVFRSITFRGREGLQGPYEMMSLGRILGEVILAGTETVYLDGELLARGKNRDYVIDYDIGTITFTPGRLITADSEIALDFQVSQERFERTTTLMGAATERLPAGLEFRFLFARERDDKDRSRAVAIGEEERQVLQEAGDNAAMARTSGVTEVPPGEGEYTRIEPDSILAIPAYYEFNDSTGNFLLSFIETGIGKGEYILGGFSREGKPIYQFKGQAQGNYTVGKKLPLPESTALLTGRLLRSQGEHVNFDLELNVSEYDRNLYSAIGDDDNTGQAGEFRVQLKDLPVKIGKLHVNSSISTINDRFRSLDKTRAWYFYRDWNLENVPLRGTEYLSEIQSVFQRGQSIELDYSLGQIDREDFSGMKHEGKFHLAQSLDRAVKGRVFTTDVEGASEKRTRQHGNIMLSYGIWAVVPTVTYAAEEYLVTALAAADSGIAYDLMRVGLAKRQPKSYSFSFDYEERNTEEVLDEARGWEKTRLNRTLKGMVSSNAGSMAHGELQVIHRSQDDYRFDNKSTSDLARVKGFLWFKQLGFRSDVDYEISQNQTRTLKKTVIFVGEGRGDYNAQGEPVGKGKGDYMLVFLPTTETVPTRSVDFTYRLNWRNAAKLRSVQPADGIWSWIAANVSLDQTISVKEESRFEPAWKIYFLVPAALQRNNSTLYGITSLRQDWSLLNGYKNVSLTVRYQREDEEENRFEGVSEDRFFGAHSLRIDRSITQRLTLVSEAKRELRRREGEGLLRGAGSSYDVNKWSILGGAGVRFTAGSTVDIDLEASTEKDAQSQAEQRAISLKPRFTWRIAQSISLFGRYEVTRFSEKSGIAVKPAFFSSAGDTHRWSVAPNVRLAQRITLLATYQGRSEKTFTGKQIVDHDFKIETRAYF